MAILAAHVAGNPTTSKYNTSNKICGEYNVILLSLLALVMKLASSAGLRDTTMIRK